MAQLLNPLIEPQDPAGLDLQPHAKIARCSLEKIGIGVVIDLHVKLQMDMLDRLVDGSSLNALAMHISNVLDAMGLVKPRRLAEKQQPSEGQNEKNQPCQRRTHPMVK